MITINELENYYVYNQPISERSRINGVIKVDETAWKSETDFNGPVKK
ncbi:MAG: hypothetical protein WCX79_00750 [Candidatus Paceibacterota bacterium]|jgi:hypothetical protein